MIRDVAMAHDAHTRVVTWWQTEAAQNFGTKATLALSPDASVRDRVQASRQMHRQQWIPSYIKGSEDKPLVTHQVAYRVAQ